MTKDHIINNLTVDSKKFEKDLLKKLQQETYRDDHHLKKVLEQTAKDMVNRYIYYESKDITIQDLVKHALENAPDKIYVKETEANDAYVIDMDNLDHMGHSVTH